jgi:NAD(P)-dependent dehydrogenase (short-subunit alcohol dehydrogenase family)
MTQPAQPSTAESLLITGAGSGIGRATARLAVQRGRSVLLVDRDEARLLNAIEELRGLAPNDRAVAHRVCDVAEEGHVEAAFAQAQAELGRVTGVVASAGIDRGGNLHELAAEDWDIVIRVNLRGTFLTCRAALRQMLPRGPGAIVCLSSPAARVGLPGGAGAYCASKGGVSALVRSLAVDYGPRAIRVNALVPGPTDTALMWANVPAGDVAAMRATVEREVPMSRMATPDEVARAALWLLSDEASYVNGSELVCDGGVLAKASVSV